MRVLITTGIFPNVADPSRGTFIHKQAVALANRCDVRVIAPVAQYLPPFSRFSPVDGSKIPVKAPFDGLDVSYPRYFYVPGIRAMNGLAVFVSTYRAHRRVVQEFDPDVILAFFAYPYGFAGAALARSFGLPVAVGCLGSDVNVMAKRFAEGQHVRWAFRSAQRVFTVSHSLAKEVEAFGVKPEQLVVIPNGIDRSQFPSVGVEEARSRLGIDSTDALITCVSRLSPEKGIDLLLHAVPRLRDPHARVVVVGDGVERTRLEEMTRALGIAKRVTFVGRRPHSEVPLWMAASQVVALPSRMEGHPNAVLEALACGRPVVGTRVGGVPEAITSDRVGIIVDPEDPSALARGMDTALEREWNAGEIAEIGQSRSWEDVAGELLRELEAMRSAGRSD